MRYDDLCGCYRGYTASFIGFAPAEAPAFVINVTIQDPKGTYYGGSLGGPVFKKVMTFVLQNKHISPSGATFHPVALDLKELHAKKRAESKAAKIEISQASNRG
jgi:cell division protein FtsI (penicillin-binding protein 3)